METQTQHGYLVLADISGYTSYLAGTELQHAQEILTELLELIVDRFKTMLTLSKLEGDAVFAYTPEARVPRGETLLELVESTYIAFRDRREAAHRRTTCTCNACRAIPTLDLKFMVHYGEFMSQRISGIPELVGSDVNLIHRLLKNHVTEATGWRAYALFTEASLAHLGVRPEGMRVQPETYEHLGEVQTHNLDLHARYDEMVSARRVLVTPEAAHVVMTLDIPMPPPEVWYWQNEPQKRTLWEDQAVSALFRPGGRTGAGARNHCVHGKQIIEETVLDWRPFDYWTVEQIVSGLRILITSQLEPMDDGNRTRVHYYIKFKMPLPKLLLAWVSKQVVNMTLGKQYRNLARLTTEAAASAPVAEPASAAAIGA